MENITHSLLGATLAEVALPKDATPRQRTAFFVTGIVAANLPDADLLYTRITPAPLGYLLHHRGHTHTVGGAVVLAAAFGLVALLPNIRASIASIEWRFGLLVVAALASHLLADSWNSYGVHALWPFTGRWYYGDAVFIAEPWLWALLGVSVAMNTRSTRGRNIISAFLIVIPVLAAFAGLVQLLALIPIALVAVGLYASMRGRAPASRTALSLVAAFVFVGVSYTLRNAVRRMAVADDRMHEHRGQVDMILNPRPGNPLCWTALSIEQSDDSLYVRHGSIGMSRGLPFDPCGGRGSGSGWTLGEVQSLAALRAAMNRDCRVRAWLQFGRAPYLHDGWISDLRFGGTGAGNFSAMQVADVGSASNCPPHLTHWDLPRADVLLSPSSSPLDPR